MIRSWHRWARAVLLTLAAASLSACAGAPVQEMSNARQAIKAARDAGAERIAPDMLNEALSLLQQAEGSLQRRAYREARRDAIAARHKAAEALDTVQPRPSMMRPDRSRSVSGSQDCVDCEPVSPALAVR